MANQAPLQEIPITKLLEDYPDEYGRRKTVHRVAMA